MYVARAESPACMAASASVKASGIVGTQNPRRSGLLFALVFQGQVPPLNYNRDPNRSPLARIAIRCVRIDFFEWPDLASCFHGDYGYRGSRVDRDVDCRGAWQGLPVGRRDSPGGFRSWIRPIRQLPVMRKPP